MNSLKADDLTSQAGVGRYLL